MTHTAQPDHDVEVDNSPEAIAESFFREVLALDYEEHCVSDISHLCDYALSGSSEPETANLPLAQRYDAWDARILPHIKERYGVDLASTDVPLFRLFEQIAKVRTAKPARGG